MDLTKFYGHTPGPWRCILNNPLAHGDVVTSEGDVVARIRGWGWLQKLPGGAAQQDANGRLIAAAPELLAEVRRLTAEAERLRAERDEARRDRDMLRLCMNDAACRALVSERDELRTQVHIITSERDELADCVRSLRAKHAELAARLAEIEAQDEARENRP